MISFDVYFLFLVDEGDCQYFCCGRCSGLFDQLTQLLNHKKNCDGTPSSSSCQLFACSRHLHIKHIKDGDPDLNKASNNRRTRSTKRKITEASSLQKGGKPSLKCRKTSKLASVKTTDETEDPVQSLAPNIEGSQSKFDKKSQVLLDTPSRSKRTRFTPTRYRDYTHDIKIETDIETTCNAKNVDSNTSNSLCNLETNVGSTTAGQDIKDPSPIKRTLNEPEEKGPQFAGKNEEEVVLCSSQKIENIFTNIGQKIENNSGDTPTDQIVCTNNSKEKELYVEIQLSDGSGHIVSEYLNAQPEEISLNGELDLETLKQGKSEDMLGQDLTSYTGRKKQSELDIVLKQECEQVSGKRTRARAVKSKEGYIKPKPLRSKEETELLEEKYKEYCIMSKVETVQEAKVATNTRDECAEKTASNNPENIGPEDAQNDAQNKSELSGGNPPESKTDEGPAVNETSSGSTSVKQENEAPKGVKSKPADGTYQCPLCAHTTKYVGFFDRHMTVVSMHYQYSYTTVSPRRLLFVWCSLSFNH